MNDKVEIPIIGSGTDTYGKEGNKFPGALRGALKKSCVPGEEFFITTKLNTMEGHQEAELKKHFPKMGSAFPYIKRYPSA